MSEKLEAARRTGDLTSVIGAMREEQESLRPSTASPAREQIDIVDGAIRLAAHLTEQGKTGAERRQVLGGVQVGTTVTAEGAAKTVLSRAEKMSKTLDWAKQLTEEQRHEFITSEKFDALTDKQQELISEAFGQVDSEAYDASVGIASDEFNWDAAIDLDTLPEDETENVGDSFEVQAGEDVESFDIDDASPWPGDAV